MAANQEIGRIGENLAAQYLKDKKYKILDRNYVFRPLQGPPLGEIDIIAKKDGIIVFVEVKTLRISGKEPLIRPEEKANSKKMRKIAIAAEGWLARKKIKLDAPWQIDIMAVKILNGENKIVHFENAVSGF
ncbi:MAG: YraN family protein [Candidatus Pacebacteria bacterium]|nr:YraN family protein [Candidatus Paceibacterota bacterium]MDD4874872.1 YraN family protein [Candidatus Paceibacterota bacterium]